MDRNLTPVRALNKALVLIAGTINTENTADPTILKGMGYSVARTGADTLVVTLVDKVPEVISCIVTGEVSLVSVWAKTSVGVVTITITVTDVADKQINFIAFLQNSTVPAK